MVLGFFWVGGSVGAASGIAGLLPEWAKTFSSLILALGACLGYYSFVRLVERRKVMELIGRGSVGEFVRGAALGVGLFSLTIGVLFLLGVFTVEGLNTLAIAVPALMTSLMAGVFEELLVRAVVFRIAEEWLGSWLALAISALLFGLAHLANPGADVLSSLAVALEAGILLTAAYMVTRRLWFPIGIHISWNFTQSGVFGIPTSGVDSKGYLQGHLQGSPILSGGTFGAEGSVVAVLVCSIAGLCMLWRARTKGNFVQPSWAPIR
jgi:membrane protease YdiL (CAAX protease family)